MAKTKFDEFISSEIEKQKGVYIPTRASLLERLLVSLMNILSRAL